jgi:radical SAM family uncharacterized protein/radical SAM-linked protein
MHHLLPVLPRPSQYLGTEPNAVHKDPSKVSVRVALAFPDLYEVGMSYLGGRILYHHVNARPRFWAERVFAPSREAAQILRAAHTPLCTLESDTPLADMDAVAFSLTHELCYSNILYMLDLAGIPFRADQRDASHPLLLAGGGVVFNAEPVARFFDILVAGDGEEVLPEILECIDQGKAKGMGREAILEAARAITGCYIPAFFQDPGPNKHDAPDNRGLHARFDDYQQVEKRIIPDLDLLDFPTDQVVPVGPVIHDRLSIEIARGCTRGCRFCQAGMIYRPVRERRTDTLETILHQALDQTGFDEVSFLSLSTGDYSCLDGLFQRTFARCQERQVSVSLPSLRVGSVSTDILDLIARIRRTGITLAPEAGSQRLRDVINKNITEEALLTHADQLFTRGWSSVKLYFMIGLPTETDADLHAIVDLCLKVAATAGPRAKRLQITASISPFVPKPHTPFQWEEQISLEETRRRLHLLKDLFRPHKRLTMRWHQPEMSFLEGIFSRGDRALADVVERAYAKGALFSSWTDSLALDLWLEAMHESNLSPSDYLRARDVDEPLPWEHISSGVRRSFLLRERSLALEANTSPDCRTGQCLGCGVCTTTGVKTALREQSHLDIHPRVNLEACPPISMPDCLRDTTDLGEKAAAFRLVFRKMGPAVYYSQLELTRLLERSMRRAKIPLGFSQGFHPMPRLSFGRALPVGVGSVREEAVVVLRAVREAPQVHRDLTPHMPRGLELLAVHPAALNARAAQPGIEHYLLHLHACPAGEEGTAAIMDQWRDFEARQEVAFEKKTKRGSRRINLRALFRHIHYLGSNRLRLVFDFQNDYLNPWTAIRAVSPDLGFDQVSLTKIRTQAGDNASTQ